MGWPGRWTLPRSFSLRIKGRALRRYGELRNQIEPQNKGGDRKSDHQCSDAPVISRASADRAAGMSVHQHKQSMNIAGTSKAEFEAAIERDDPPIPLRFVADVVKGRSESHALL